MIYKNSTNLPRLTVGNYMETTDEEVVLIENALNLATNNIADVLQSYQSIADPSSSNQGPDVSVLSKIKTVFNLDQDDIRLKQQKAIAQNVIKIYNGLVANITILNIPKSDWEKNQKLYVDRSKTHQIGDGTGASAPQVGLLGYVRGAIPAISGDIHVAFAYAFNTPATAWTIIHEASHKFCGTNDNAYFNEPKYPQLTAKQRINNADNYGELLM